VVIHNSLTRYKRAPLCGGEKLWPREQPDVFFRNPDYENNRRHGERRRATGGTCPRSLRKRVVAAFAGVCQYCGWHPSTSVFSGKLNYLTVDRLIPGGDGGRYVPTNVTLACLHCNSKRQTGTVYGPARPLSVVEVRHDR
jgi:5-methylcytosine-specific restriction endonuclease McrA